MGEGLSLATVSTEAGHAPARGESKVSAHSKSVITQELGQALMQYLPGNGFKLQVNVKGHLPARVSALFGLTVRVTLECVVEVDVLKIMSNPDDLVTGHTCKYGVAF